MPMSNALSDEASAAQGGSLIASSFVEGTQPPRVVLPPPTYVSITTTERRGVMEGRVAVVMELLLRTLRLAGPLLPQTQLSQNQQDFPSSVSSNFSGGSNSSLPSLTPNSPFVGNHEHGATHSTQAPIESASSPELLEIQNTLSSLFKEHAQLLVKYRAAELQYSQHTTSQAIVQDRQKLPRLQRQVKQLLLEINVKKSHIDLNCGKLRDLDPSGADSFINKIADTKSNGLKPFSSIGSGGPLAVNKSVVVRESVSGTMHQLPFGSAKQPPGSPNFLQHHGTERPQLDQNTIQILRRISILVASAFADQTIDPLGTHFLLHALILIRRFLFPPIPRPTNPETDSHIGALKRDPISLYLCALMLVECQLRDGQTSTQIWKKWLSHAINDPSDSLHHFESVSASLVLNKRILVSALDHNILVSMGEYDMFLSVFRGCLSARNSKTFSDSYAENQGSLGRLGGSEGPGIGAQRHAPFGSTAAMHVTQNGLLAVPGQAVQQLHYGLPQQERPHLQKPIRLAPIRNAYSYNPAVSNGTFDLPSRPVAPKRATTMRRSPLVNVSSTDSLGSVVYSMPVVGSPIADSSVSLSGGSVVLPMPQGMLVNIGLASNMGSGFGGVKRCMDPESGGEEDGDTSIWINDAKRRI